MTLNSFCTKVANALLELSVGILLKCHPEWVPRIWSNREIKRFGCLFEGDVLNLSGWKDGDKQGGRYCDYFPNARSYTVSNYGPERGSSGLQEKELDLSKPYEGEIGTYDLVFNHTVIEHVHPIDTVIRNLCKLSNDCIMTVVPFVQQMHGVKEGFTDYYRYSPVALEKLFREQGFETIYVSWNKDHPLMNVYIFHLASKKPEKYRKQIPESDFLELNESGPGVLWAKYLYPHEKDKSIWRQCGEFIGGAVRLR
jgi:hypothetical protein